MLYVDELVTVKPVCFFFFTCTETSYPYGGSEITYVYNSTCMIANVIFSDTHQTTLLGFEYWPNFCGLEVVRQCLKFKMENESWGMWGR